MRSATTAFVTLLAVLAAAPAAADPATELGQAYRAFEAGDYQRARDLAAAIDRGALVNDDYVLYVMAQSASMLGDHEEAMRWFRELDKERGSRFHAVVEWRLADSLWQLGRHAEARKAYQRLVDRKTDEGDGGVARFRIAESYARDGDRDRAVRELERYQREHPGHVYADRAEARLLELVGAEDLEPSPRDRIERAKALKEVKLWHEAIAELAAVGDDVDEDTRLLRDYWTGMTLFSMRRQYRRAGDLLLGLYKKMGSDAPYAMFHGARALSRADYDTEAIEWYQRLVDEYPSSYWAAEAQFLSGWLEFNMGNYEPAIEHLQAMRKRFPRSKWVAQAIWFQALSHYLHGQLDQALPLFERVAQRSGKLEGGKGHYWQARTLQRLGREDEAVREYRALVGRYPFSWYALMARSRLKAAKVDIAPFGDDPRASDANTDIDTEVDESLASDRLIRGADELLAAGLGIEAGIELRRGEKAFIKRHKRAAALAMLMDRYRRGGDFNRPWMLAVVYGSWQALNAPPEGQARIWWQHAYPLAYRELIEKHRGLGKNPDYYLFAIMRKESGFDPHTWSYADAIGLLQMIPPTTRRVAEELGIPYTDDLLYDPELNIKTASWYIGNLLQKFKGQIPLGSGSFNSGPRPVMRWCDLNGERPIDEFVELVSYSQTREYMKKVTETYARYLYLYGEEIYEQPLEVDCDYVDNQLTY